MKLGVFRVVSDLKSGVGNQGSVYKAVCEGDAFPGVARGTVVALKVIPVQGSEWGWHSRMKERADEIARIRHPNVVRYFGCFSESTAFDDVHVVVLEYLEGESLKDRLFKCPTGLDADETLRIGKEALAGLVHISSLGIVHRDIKPGNIFLCADGGVKLIDFEVARQDDGAATTTGDNLIGTFDYMAPDFTRLDFRGDEVSDIFSFGVCLHEMLTGRTPYRRQPGEDSQASFAFLSRWSRTDDWINPVKTSSRIKKVLSGAENVLTRALQIERDKRFRSFAEFSGAFAKIRFWELSYGGETWRLLAYIGRGGFGEVLKAREIHSGRLVAIKHLLKRSYADRFRREAKLMAKLNDACFVKFRSFFEMNIRGADAAFIVMDFLEGMPGSSLRDEIKRSQGEPLKREAVVEAFARYARGLAALHAKGMVHRDIKPSNLYFPANAIGAAAIMDFGIARDASGTETVGNVPGTLDYMPPEVAVEGSRGDGAMDVYALGLCLYEALSGKMAYPRLSDGAAGYREFFERARNRTPPKLDASAYRDEPVLVALVEKMTDPDYSRRLKDAALVAKRLSSLLHGKERAEERKSDDFLAVESIEGAEAGAGDAETAATIAPGEEMLEWLRRDAAGSHGVSLLGMFSSAWIWICAAIMLVAACGGWYAYRMHEMREAAVIERQRLEALRIEDERRRAAAAAEVEAENRRRALEEKAAEEKRLQEERRLKEEAQQKALAEALQRIEKEKASREAAERRAAAERKAEEARKAAEAARLEAEKERLRQEAERLAREKAEVEAKRKAEADAAAKRLAEEARLKAEREARLKKEAEAKRKAARELAARKEAEAKRKAAEEAGRRKAQRRRSAEAGVVPHSSAKAEALRNLEKLKTELDAYREEYERKRAAALKPGSRENPNDLDREWYMRLRKYRQLKKKVEAMK